MDIEKLRGRVTGIETHGYDDFKTIQDVLSLLDRVEELEGALDFLRRRFGLILFDGKEKSQVTYTWPTDMKGPILVDFDNPLAEWLRHYVPLVSQVECPRCEGNGTVQGNMDCAGDYEFIYCEDCNGTGKVQVS